MSQKENYNFQIDFMGIGMPKSGTSWLYFCLGKHPQICVSKPKELHFFNKNHGFHKPNESWRYKWGMDWYKKHFAHCKPNQIKGEIDPAYYEKETLQLIKKHFPKVKIIISLRNPIERAYSNYYHFKAKDTYKDLFTSFEEAIEKEPEFKERGLYSKYIKNCFEIFPKENILILIYEDIEKDPIGFIQGVYKFLGVDKTFVPKNAYRKVNAAVVRMSKISKFIQRTYQFLVKFMIGRILIKILKKIGIRKSLFDFFILRFKKLPKIKLGVRITLQNFYKEDIKELEKLINRKLSFWK